MHALNSARMTQEQQSSTSGASLGELQPRSSGRRSIMTVTAEKTFTVEGIRIPDSRLAREITQLVRDTESALLFHHSSRVYYWGALAGKHRGLKFDRELLYAGARRPNSPSIKEEFEGLSLQVS